MLIKEREDKQICYNLLVSLWIATFKPYARHFFEHRQNEFIENIIKVLQLHGNEKIVRIILYIFKVIYIARIFIRTYVTMRRRLNICWTATWTKK